MARPEMRCPGCDNEACFRHGCQGGGARSIRPDEATMTTLIKQRFEKDCFLCCLAMAAGLDYDAALARFGDELVERVKVGGTYDKDVGVAFAQLGFEKERDYRALFIMPEYASIGFLRNVLWGRRACIQVRSKNFAGEMHIVYWDGAALFDPSPKRTYEWEEVEPVYIWLFCESPR